MRISYDKEADAIAIWFEGVSSAKTLDVTQDIFIDTDEEGRLAGIEILHASEKTNLKSLFSVRFADVVGLASEPRGPGMGLKGYHVSGRMRVRRVKLMRALTRDGWYEVKSKGGHRNFKHPVKPGIVTIPVPGTQEIAPWLLHKIVAQAGLTVEEFKKLL